jgi:gluconokinase
MAAALDRPLRVVEGAEGTALGAAALGLFALGRAPNLTDAMEQLAGSDDLQPPPVAVPQDLIATYAHLRSRVPTLVDAIARDVG